MSPCPESRQYLACHEEILRLVRAMHDAARQGDWIKLSELQVRYIGQVDLLKAAGDSPDLSAGERAHRYEILQAILFEDAAIRNLVAPAFARISSLLDSGRRQQALAHAYRAAE